jgi:hypothetical protein
MGYQASPFTQKKPKKEDRMQQNQTLPAYLTERLTAV